MALAGMHFFTLGGEEEVTQRGTTLYKDLVKSFEPGRCSEMTAGFRLGWSSPTRTFSDCLYASWCQRGPWPMIRRR